MATDTVTFFFALLAITGQAALAGLVGLRVTSSPGWSAVRDALRPLLPWFAVVVSVTCTAGSLYLSEVAHFRPCRLCWAQRGFMYPLVAVTLYAAIRRSRSARTIVIAASLCGGLVSTYHVLLEHFPNLESGTCDPNNPCSLIWVRQLGYVTIPVMALTGFSLLAAAMLLQRSLSGRSAS